MRDLHKSCGAFHAVNGVSFDIARGETFALLGPNGSGKSSTIEILEDYRHRTSSEVSVLGVDTAVEILNVAGANPKRIRSEAAFAKLAGISPVPTGSVMTSRKHRIHHGGHRQLNAAIYRTVIVRMRFREPTLAYIARRTIEGKSKRDIIPCLKRYVICEVYHLIKANPRTGEIESWQL